MAEKNELPYTITFEDQRDFCRFASILIGAAYASAPDALKRFRDGSLLGERTWGKVTAAQARIEALELDARRYRWLMDNYARGVGFDRIDDVLNEGDANGRLSAAIDASIDAAIDAELAKDNRP